MYSSFINIRVSNAMKYNILVLTTAVLLAGCGSSESTRPLQIAVTVDGAGNVIPENSEGTETVSYTHLTLPTIYSV